MRTSDLFTNNRSAKKINESIQKVFGRKLNLENFDLPQLEDARNKLRTQLHTERSKSGFNETIENEALTQAQWMLDAINSEIAQREEFVNESDDANDADTVLPLLKKFISMKTDPADKQDMIKVYRAFEQGMTQGFEVLSQQWGSNLDAEFYHFAKQQGVDMNDIAREHGALKDSVREETPTSGDYLVDSLFADWMRTEYAPMDDDSGDYNRVMQLAYQYLTDRNFDKTRRVDAAEKMANMFHGETESISNQESQQFGESMRKVTEGEIQQASAIVTAKTMVDRVGRWIEELSGMENDTLLQLGDSIRDEMGQEQAKQFISAVAPAIQSALENLKTTRETLASGVRTLTGEEQAAGMLGAGPEVPGVDAAAPDAMNAEPEMGDEMDMEPADEFGASDAAVGGAETAGREKRESIDYGNRLLKVLAG